MGIPSVDWSPQVARDIVTRFGVANYPGDATGPQRNLIKYWLRAIPWQAKGAYRMCLARLTPKVAGKLGVDVHGMCANLHKAATGKWPTEGNHHG